MRILSFDTSTSVLHLCLLHGREPLLERELTPSSANRQEVASLIMPEIDRGFREVGWRKDQLELIVVGVGPGSFTGIRVAVITARTLAQVLKLPLIGISSLESFYAGSETKEPGAVVLSTTSAQFFFAGFARAEKDPVSAVVSPGAGAIELVEEKLAAIQQWFVDEAAERAINDFRCHPLPKLKNIATTQAQIAVDRLSLNGLWNGDVGSPKLAETFPWWNVLPLYLRSPSVTLKKTYADQNPAHESR